MVCLMDLTVSVGETAAYNTVLRQCLIDRSEEAAIRSMERGILMCSLLKKQSSNTADPNIVRLSIDGANSVAATASRKNLVARCSEEL